MPVFCSNSKNCICFPLHINISLISFHPSSCITALVRQQESVFLMGQDFFLRVFFCRSFICGCCNAFKTLILWMCAVCVEGSRAEFMLQSRILQFKNLELLIMIVSEGNGSEMEIEKWRFLTLCFELSCDQAVVAALYEYKHLIRPLDSSLCHCQVDWSTASPHGSQSGLD